MQKLARAFENTAQEIKNTVPAQILVEDYMQWL